MGGLDEPAEVGATDLPDGRSSAWAAWAPVGGRPVLFSSGPPRAAAWASARGPSPAGSTTADGYWTPRTSTNRWPSPSRWGRTFSLGVGWAILWLEAEAIVTEVVS